MRKTTSPHQQSERWSGRRFKAVAGLLMTTLVTLLVVVSTGAAYQPDIVPSRYFPVAYTPTVSEAGPDYGVVFMSSAEDPADAQQYQNALATGARWNRWPLYWPSVEQSQGVFNWSAHDALIQADISHGLRINAILLGTPAFYSTRIASSEDVQRPERLGNYALSAPESGTPQGLFEPVFSDGTDVPGPGKSINPTNPWARFVFTTVTRYKPNGILAQANQWPAGAGVTHWEMWNEPDLPWFWDGTLPEYARLLKVGYLATIQADSTAQVLFAGLANNFERLTYYDEVLDIYDADPLAAPHNYFHHILATHSYFYSWQSWYHVYRAVNTQRDHGLDKPIWLNESGVPAWNDYPGPIWDPTSALRATMGEQADFVIQSAFYARFAGADAIFHFQLYDGCGNQPRGTDFPPHNGSLCATLPICAGDANGLFRNPTDAACFTQHPNPETPRPNFTAFQLLTTHLTDVTPLWRQRPGGPDPTNGPQEWIAFYRPSTRERVLGLWARFGTAQTANVPATGTSALLVAPNGNTQVLTPVNGVYSLGLPAATNLNAPWDPTLHAIGGRPYILVERDLIAPNVTVGATADGNLITVTWSGEDLGSGVKYYDVFVAVNSGPAVPWLMGVTQTSAVYTGAVGQSYTFSVRAVDTAGNVSALSTVSISTLN